MFFSKSLKLDRKKILNTEKDETQQQGLLLVFWSSFHLLRKNGFSVGFAQQRPRTLGFGSNSRYRCIDFGGSHCFNRRSWHWDSESWCGSGSDAWPSPPSVVTVHFWLLSRRLCLLKNKPVICSIKTTEIMIYVVLVNAKEAPFISEVCK